MSNQPAGITLGHAALRGSYLYVITKAKPGELDGKEATGLRAFYTRDGATYTLSHRREPRERVAYIYIDQDWKVQEQGVV